MRPAVASQLQTWWLHMTEFLVMEELWLTNGFWDPLCIARAWHCILILEVGFIFIWSHFGRQKKKSISKFQNWQCKRVCNPWVSNTLAVYLDFLPLLDFFLESFFLVFSGGGGGYSSSSLSSSSPCPSSSSSSSSSLSSLSLPPGELAFQLVNELGPLLVVALGAMQAPLSSSSLLPWELTLTLRCLHFNMQSLVNTINENLDSNENNLNTNRNWIPTKPTHQ